MEAKAIQRFVRITPRKCNQVLELIRRLCQEVNASLLLVSHDLNIARQLPRVLTLADLNRASATARVGRVFSITPIPPTRPGGTTLADLLGQIFLIVIRAKVSGQWVRLKTCRSDICRWAYYDDSRNRTGQWCAMSICGSQSKMRRYRARLVRQAAKA